MSTLPDTQRGDAPLACKETILVIGAGIGGLSAALRLAGAGHPVRVVEAADRPGGKLRAVASVAGPVDAGPTVMTMRPVFEALFESAGLSMQDYVATVAEPVLARHWWQDGSSLDLYSNADQSAEAIRDFGGARAERDFRAFHDITGRMFRAFERPVMQSGQIDLSGIMTASLRDPRIMTGLLPGRTMWNALSASFKDPRLRQLFGRYATYVGGSPFRSPALLSLIWQAEARGVWRVKGGMARLAQGIERAATELGVRFTYETTVKQIRPTTNDAFHVTFSDGSRQTVGQIVFNGDPAALYDGLLGPAPARAAGSRGVRPRSLSAHVWSFAARPTGRPLTHHNVFFSADYAAEFRQIEAGQIPTDATLYVCAQDRGHGLEPPATERFEIIMNAAPTIERAADDQGEHRECQTRVFNTLSAHGLDFDPLPTRECLTTPQDFAARFPGSAGSLYGRSPHGMMASFLRPTVRSAIPGLYMAGGGIHPGAGLPMAATSGRLAAEAILTDLASTSRSRRTVMRGGMSMDSRMTASTASRSSPS